MRLLDALIDHLATRPADRQPPDLRVVLHLGLYQLTFLSQIPTAAAVSTSVDLAKHNGLSGLTGVVNGLLRRYVRDRAGASMAIPESVSRTGAAVLAADHQGRSAAAPSTAAAAVEVSAAATLAPLPPFPVDVGMLWPSDPVQRLGVQYSYPDWIVQQWLDRLGAAETEQLCHWFDQSPSLDLRVNRLRSDPETVRTALAKAGVTATPIPQVPNALRIDHWDVADPAVTPRHQPYPPKSKIEALPGFAEGWWMVQDASAQLAALLLDPQPGETIVDACAAPGGKTAHIAELMGDVGEVWAIDRAKSRLKKLHQNVQRLQLQSVRVRPGDSSTVLEPTVLSPVPEQCDRLLLDAPCSGLGTLHRRADARWRQTPDTVREVVALQTRLLDRAATWVKPGGVLVYATCTISAPENGALLRDFGDRHPDWAIEPPAPGSPLAPFATPEGWLEVWPHRWNMDGFFLARLRRQ
jgi:16S rRNA (cytosine967-C5)-methyltransferase